MGKDERVTVGTGNASSERALERYSARLRRERLWYTVAVSIVVVAASIITTFVWLSGEISHTTLHTIAKPPADVPLVTTSATQHQLWTTTDHPAMGVPYSGGSVVTYDDHTVRGRNGRTGTQTWSYTRTDRTVCAAVQFNDVTVAVYRLNGNCDELTGLDTGTGKRQWTRTLDFDTHQLNGMPQISIGTDAVMFVSPTVIYSVNVGSGYNDWIFAERGCTISNAVLGSAGALISQTCAHRDCTDMKFCRNGPQLVFRDPTTGQNTDSSKNGGNPDQIDWVVPNPDHLVPASGGTVISAYVADGSRLQIFTAKDGKTAATVPVHTSPAALATSTDTSVSDGELLFSGGTTYAVVGTPGAVEWSIPTDVAPTVTSGAIAIGTTLSESTLTMAGSTGIVELDADTGAVKQTVRPQPGAAGHVRVYPYGSGFLVAGSTVAAYG